MQRISFQTSDSVTIYGDWSLPEKAKYCVLCLHMMPATRVSWLPLSRALNEAGFATLAIDLRGHGESTGFEKSVTLSLSKGEKLDYKKFSDKEHQASRLDVDAAVNFLKSNGFAEPAISFAGASIGANLSLDALARYSGATKAILLSPGLDYRGVKTESAMRDLSANQKVWIIAAERDEYSAQSSITLQQIQKENATLTIYGGSDHGTNLFGVQPALIPGIVKFLQE